MISYPVPETGRGFLGPYIHWADGFMSTGHGEGMFDAWRWGNAQPYWCWDHGYEYGLAVVDDFGSIVKTEVFHK